MVNGTCSHTPFCFGCHDFVNSSTAKRNAMLLHTHIRMYATIEWWTDEQNKKYDTNISCHERTGYIILNIMDCFYVV